MLAQSTVNKADVGLHFRREVVLSGAFISVFGLLKDLCRRFIILLFIELYALFLQCFCVCAHHFSLYMVISKILAPTSRKRSTGILLSSTAIWIKPIFLGSAAKACTSSGN